MRTHTLIVLAALAVTPAALADNFAECLLDKLPGVQNRAVTLAALNLCRKQYPRGFEGMQQGTGRGFFARFDSGGECTMKLGRDAADHQGAFLIARSCRALYDPSEIDRFLDEPIFDPSTAVIDEPAPLIDTLYPEGGPWNNYTPVPAR